MWDILADHAIRRTSHAIEPSGYDMLSRYCKKYMAMRTYTDNPECRDLLQGRINVGNGTIDAVIRDNIAADDLTLSNIGNFTLTEYKAAATAIGCDFFVEYTFDNQGGLVAKPIDDNNVTNETICVMSVRIHEEFRHYYEIVEDDTHAGTVPLSTGVDGCDFIYGSAAEALYVYLTDYTLDHKARSARIQLEMLDIVRGYMENTPWVKYPFLPCSLEEYLKNVQLKPATKEELEKCGTVKEMGPIGLHILAARFSTCAVVYKTADDGSGNAALYAIYGQTQTIPAVASKADNNVVCIVQNKAGMFSIHHRLTLPRGLCEKRIYKDSVNIRKAEGDGHCGINSFWLGYTADPPTRQEVIDTRDMIVSEVMKRAQAMAEAFGNDATLERLTIEEPQNEAVVAFQNWAERTRQNLKEAERDLLPLRLFMDAYPNYMGGKSDTYLASAEMSLVAQHHEASLVSYIPARLEWSHRFYQRAQEHYGKEGMPLVMVRHDGVNHYDNIDYAEREKRLQAVRGTSW